MDEDEVLGKITRLLEKGCTMLATHHECGAPLFRCQGEVVCPVCSFVDGPSPLPEGQPSVLSEAEVDIDPNSGRAHFSKRDDEQLMRAKSDLRSSLLQRLQEFTAALKEESDLDKLKKQLDCLEGLLKVLRSLQW